MNTSLRAGGTRAALLPITSVATLISAHIELRALGASRFGILTLLLTITLLLPFADLGIGAAVTTAMATHARREREELLAASLRVLFAVAVAAIFVAAVLSLFDVWRRLLGLEAGEVPALNRDMLVVVTLFSVGLPLGVGARVLLGLDRFSTSIVVQALIPFLTLAIVYWFRNSHDVTPFLIAPFVGQIAASLITFGIALRLLRFPASALVARLIRSNRRPSGEIRKTAVPMMLITLGLPVALQTDRLVLSHVSTRSSLSQYAVVSMLYVPSWSIISSAGMTLWPRFARLRARGNLDERLSYDRAFRTFAGVGAVSGIGFVLLGPLITRVWAGQFGGSIFLWCAFAALLLVQAAHLPGGMYLTDPVGLRFQAMCVLAMCGVNLPLSVALAQPLGAVGPVVASTVTILCFQLTTARWLILRAGRAEVM